MSELVAYHLPGAWGLPSVSPFCLKLDAYLRMTGIPHKAATAPTPFGGPKRKAPWIEHEGKKIGDSGFIIDYLRMRFGVDPDKTLGPAERGVALALRRLIEENLYWTMVYDRWMVDENWQLFRNTVLGGISVPMRYAIAPMARRGVRQQLRGHGIGVHSREEIHAIGKRDIGALADVLGDKPFFFGSEPSEIDAIAYGQLANIVLAPIASPVKDEALNRKNLTAFLDRFRTRYYA
jgi:glutathione S-transferase